MNERYLIIPTMFGSEREIIENEPRGLKNQLCSKFKINKLKELVAEL